MKILSDEKSRMLAEQFGWSLDYARGCVEGETSRRLGKSLSRHALVGIDDYSQGFRAGFFEREAKEGVRAGGFESNVRRAEFATAV